MNTHEHLQTNKKSNDTFSDIQRLFLVVEFGSRLIHVLHLQTFSMIYWILMDFAYSENTPSDSLHSGSPTVALTADPRNQVISAVSTLESA